MSDIQKIRGVQRKLEPGYCSFCTKSLISLFKFKLEAKYDFSYFYLVEKESPINSYIVFLCNECLTKIICFQENPMLSNLQLFLEKNSFHIDQPFQQKKAQKEIFDIKFEQEGQRICSKGTLKKQVSFCDECVRYESILQNYDEQLINYASCNYGKAFLLAKLLAMEQYKQDIQFFQIYKQKLAQTKNEKEKFYLNQKLKSLQMKYSQKLPQRLDSNVLKAKIFYQQ